MRCGSCRRAALPPLPSPHSRLRRPPRTLPATALIRPAPRSRRALTDGLRPYFPRPPFPSLSGRSWRMGQTRPVTVKTFVVRDTVEQRIVAVARARAEAPSAGANAEALREETLGSGKQARGEAAGRVGGSCCGAAARRCPWSSLPRRPWSSHQPTGEWMSAQCLVCVCVRRPRRRRSRGRSRRTGRT